MAHPLVIVNQAMGAEISGESDDYQHQAGKSKPGGDLFPKSPVPKHFLAPRAIAPLEWFQNAGLPRGSAMASDGVPRWRQNPMIAA